MTDHDLKFDHIGYWSEIKLRIVRDYAAAYSRILATRTAPRLHHSYIDAFSGPGYHISRRTGEMVEGSPLNAVYINPPFREYSFIDLDGDKADLLSELTAHLPNVNVYKGDCNKLLLTDIFPRVPFAGYRRALCLLDPYGMNLDWKVVAEAGKTGSIEVFLNFPVMAMHRNVLWSDAAAVSAGRAARLTRLWGDESWKTIAYPVSQSSLWAEPELRKAPPSAIVNAFRQRLIDVAGFAHVPEPIPMRNSKGNVIYWLFFATSHRLGNNIVRDIFDKYRDRGFVN